MRYRPDTDGDRVIPATFRQGVMPWDSPYARNGHHRGVEIPKAEQQEVEATRNGRVDPWVIEAIMEYYNG